MKALFGMLLGALIACGGGSGESPGATSPTDNPAVAAMQGFANQICQCSDNACIQQGQHDMKHWMRHQSEAHGDMTPEEAEALDKIQALIDTCINNIQISR